MTNNGGADPTPPGRGRRGRPTVPDNRNHDSQKLRIREWWVIVRKRIATSDQAAVTLFDKPVCDKRLISVAEDNLAEAEVLRRFACEQ